MSLPSPYYISVSREELFGTGDTGKNSVIKLIAVDGEFYKKLDPTEPEHSISDKEQYYALEQILMNNKFTNRGNGYFEYNRLLPEKKMKSTMENLGFHQYD